MTSIDTYHSKPFSLLTGVVPGAITRVLWYELAAETGRGVVISTVGGRLDGSFLGASLAADAGSSLGRGVVSRNVVLTGRSAPVLVMTVAASVDTSGVVSAMCTVEGVTRLSGASLDWKGAGLGTAGGSVGGHRLAGI